MPQERLLNLTYLVQGPQDYRPCHFSRDTRQRASAFRCRQGVGAAIGHREYTKLKTPQVFIEIDVLRLAKTVVVVHFVLGFYSLLEFLCPDGPWQQLME